MNDKKFGKKEGELILFNDLFVSSNFIMRKATLAEAAQVVPLMWIEVDIAKRQKWVEQLNAESLSAENAVVLYGPERSWYIKMKNLKERNEFVEYIAKVVGIADMGDKAAMREGTRKGGFTFTMPKGHYDGEWMAGQMHGRGKYTRDDGAVFDGYWDARIMAGFGVVILPGQEPFTSGWLNNRTNEGGNVEVASKEHDFWSAGGLTDSDWQVLLLGAQEVTMKKDEKIIEQGITNENLYKVKSGTIRVEKQLPDGSKKLLVKLGANETFGDTSVLQSLATATASVIADSEQVVLRVIQIDLVFEIFKNNPGLCMRFYRQMATKLAERLRNLHNKAPLPKKEDLKAESSDGPGSSGPASTASSGEHTPTLTERLSTRNLKRVSMHSADLDSNSGTSTPRENTPATERKNKDKDKKEKEKEKDKKKQVAEVSFHEKFDLPLTEVVIKEVRCEIKMSTSKKPGQMYISQRYVCFDSSLFGSHTKEVVQLSKVTDITMKKKDLKLKMKKNQYTFIFNASLEEVHSLIVSLWEKAKQEAGESGDGQGSGPASAEVSSRKLESKPSRRISLNPQTAKASLEPKATEEDWRLVLQGAKDLHFQKDQVILKEGLEHQCVYQIVHGNCRIEKETPEGVKKVLGSMEQGQLFGEMSFLQGGGATVSVVADEEVTVYVIEGDYINALFGRHPDLAGRFYHFLSSVLANRLNKRESDLAKAEEKAKSRRAKSKRISTHSTDQGGDDLAKSSEDGANPEKKRRKKKEARESGDDWSKLESQISAKHDEVESEFARANSNLVNIPEEHEKDADKKKKASAEGESGPSSDNPKKIRKTKSTRDTKSAVNPIIVVEEEKK
jgi:CRP-like cAMP-binding protein